MFAQLNLLEHIRLATLEARAFYQQLAFLPTDDDFRS